MNVPTTFIGDNIYMRLLSPGNYLSSWGVIMGNLEYVDMGVTQSNIYGEVDCIEANILSVLSKALLKKL